MAERSRDDLAPLLVQMDQLLDEDARLETLADAFGSSPFQFHRRFSRAVGQSPKRYVDRVRLERAAYRLAVTDATVLEIALSLGYATHETFSRAFRRMFGRAPIEYRRWTHTLQRERFERSEGFRGEGCQISEARFERQRLGWLLAIRRVGAYAAFNPAEGALLWGELEAFARRAGAVSAEVRIGLFPDDPGMTAPELQQADICIAVDRPIEGEGRIRSIELAGGVYGVIDHIGPEGTVSQAYRCLADAIRRSGRYGFREDPPVHVFHLYEPDQDHRRSELRFPVKPLR